MKRVLTAIALIPPAAYLAVWAPYWALTVAVAGLALVCFHEYRHMLRVMGMETLGPFGYAAGLVILLAPRAEILVVTLLAMLALALSLRAADPARVLPQAAMLLFGAIYVFGCWRCALGLRQISPYWLLYALMINWVGDISAFYFGRKFGKHRLAPGLSPKKTWEGSIASVAGSCVLGGAFLHFLIAEISIPEILILTVLANVAGQFGDLCESAIKRGAHVKDSGTFLPGHGGWLDRLDSSLFAMPVVYFWLLRPWEA